MKLVLGICDDLPSTIQSEVCTVILSCFKFLWSNNFVYVVNYTEMKTYLKGTLSTRLGNLKSQKLQITKI